MSKNMFSELFNEIATKISIIEESERVELILNELASAFTEATGGNCTLTFIQSKTPTQSVGKRMTLVMRYRDGNSVLQECSHTYNLFDVHVNGAFPIKAFVEKLGIERTCHNEDEFFQFVKDYAASDAYFARHIGRAKAFVEYKAHKKSTKAKANSKNEGE